MGLAARLFRGVCPVPCPSPHLPAAQSHEKAFRSHGSFAGAALQGLTLGHRPGGLCPAPRPGPARELTASSPRVLPRALACVLAEMILMLPTGWHHEHVLTGKTAVALRTQAPHPPGSTLPVCLLLSCSRGKWGHSRCAFLDAADTKPRGTLPLQGGHSREVSGRTRGFWKNLVDTKTRKT